MQLCKSRGVNHEGTVPPPPKVLTGGIECLISPAIFNPYENKETSFLMIEGVIGAIVPLWTGLGGFSIF
jgi:hypothetical protein